MTDRYILTADHRIEPEPDLLTWARWFETADRHVGCDMIGPYRISTVFLGLDHDYMQERVTRSDPLVFETMIFDDSKLESSPFFSAKFHLSFHFQRRYRSWEAAKAGHAYAVRISERMLRWLEFRSQREAREVAELKKMLP